MSIDKNLLKDEKGRYLTQGLFFEVAQNPSNAVFTLDGEDKNNENNRAVRPLISLKKRFLEMEDPFEYEFATTWLVDWEHWQRILANKLLFRHINKWREELEIKIRSAGFQQMLDKASTDNDIQAIKYIANRGWDIRSGRPNKSEQEKEARFQNHLEDEFKGDIIRLGIGNE